MLLLRLVTVSLICTSLSFCEIVLKFSIVVFSFSLLLLKFVEKVSTFASDFANDPFLLFSITDKLSDVVFRFAMVCFRFAFVFSSNILFTLLSNSFNESTACFTLAITGSMLVVIFERISGLLILCSVSPFARKVFELPGRMLIDGLPVRLLLMMATELLGIFTSSRRFIVTITSVTSSSSLLIL